MEHRNSVSPAEQSTMAKNGNQESKSELNSPQLPVPVFVWRVFLVLAVFLYSSYTIIIHLCEENGRLPFRTSAVVFLTELLKLFLSIGMFALGADVCNTANPFKHFALAVRSEFRQYNQPYGEKLDLDAKMASVTCSSSSSSVSTLPVTAVPVVQQVPLSWYQLIGLVVPFTVPAVLYAINNNLGMLIQLEMDPATYQVLGNFKILSTAILFRLIIKRPLTLLQWFSLLLLLLAGITHSYGSLMAKSASKAVNLTAQSAHAPQEAGVASSETLLHISFLGIMMISVYCTISGLSGVYTEYVMKKRARMSIHLQNAMLYIFGVLLNGMVFVLDVLRSDGNVSVWSLFDGFSLWIWFLIVTQSISGIFMGFVMKYSTNITRLFIISSAMLVTTVLAVWIFSLRLNAYFAGSFLLVSASLYLYHR